MSGSSSSFKELNIKNTLILSLLFILIASCSQLIIKGDSEVMLDNDKSTLFSFNERNGYLQSEKIEVPVDFFLLGALPSDQAINIEQILIKRGHQDVAELTIKKEVSGTDVLWRIFTVGIYWPSTLTISFKLPSESLFKRDVSQ